MGENEIEVLRELFDRWLNGWGRNSDSDEDEELADRADDALEKISQLLKEAKS